MPAGTAGRPHPTGPTGPDPVRCAPVRKARLHLTLTQLLLQAGYGAIQLVGTRPFRCATTATAGCLARVGCYASLLGRCMKAQLKLLAPVGGTCLHTSRRPCRAVPCRAGRWGCTLI